MKFFSIIVFSLVIISCSNKQIILSYEQIQSDKGDIALIKNNKKKIVEIQGFIIKDSVFTNSSKNKMIFENVYYEKFTQICEVWYVDGIKNKPKKLFTGVSKQICADPELNYLFIQDNEKKKQIGMPVVEVYELPTMTLKYVKKFPEFENESIGVETVYYQDGKFFYNLQNDFDGTELLEIDLAKL